MGEFHMAALCYDDVVKRHGKDAAQEMWERNGGTGKFVPGMVAEPGLGITESGTIIPLRGQRDNS